MANDSYSQQVLAMDVGFRMRVQAALAKVAFQVLSEDVATPGHDKRAAYADTVIKNLPASAQGIAPWLVERPNVFSFETTYSFQAQATFSAAGDLDLEAQLTSDWNFLAGV